MKIKEREIRKSIKIIEERIKEIDSILSATPLADIISLRREAHKLVASKQKGYADKRIVRKMHKLAERERELLDVAKKQEKTAELIEEKVKLGNELVNLKSELYYLQKH